MTFSPHGPERRYHTDAMFRKVVDTLEALIHDAHLTPSEIREAAVLAATHYEMRALPKGWVENDGGP